MKIFQTTQLAGMLLILAAGHAVAASGATPSSPFKPIQPINMNNGQQAPNYLGASLGKVTADGFCEELQQCDNGDKSWKVFAGVRLNENIVLEGGYVDFGEQTGQASGTTPVNQQVTAYTAAAVAGLPISEQIEVFGKAGMARWSAEGTDTQGQTDNSGTDVMVGIGADYDLGENMGVRAEWERFTDIGARAGQESDLDLLSIGITFSSL